MAARTPPHSEWPQTTCVRGSKASLLELVQTPTNDVPDVQVLDSELHDGQQTATPTHQHEHTARAKHAVSPYLTSLWITVFAMLRCTNSSPVWQLQPVTIEKNAPIAAYWLP